MRPDLRDSWPSSFDAVGEEESGLRRRPELEPTAESGDFARLVSSIPPPPFAADGEDVIVHLDVPLLPPPVPRFEVVLPSSSPGGWRTFALLCLGAATISTTVLAWVVVAPMRGASSGLAVVDRGESRSASGGTRPSVEAISAPVTAPDRAAIGEVPQMRPAAIETPRGMRGRRAHRRRATPAVTAQPQSLVATTPPARAAAPQLDLPDAPSRAQVREAFEAARPTLDGCAAGRHGAAIVRATVRPDGRVSSAVVTGAFAGTPQGSCIARAMRSVRLPPFSGAPVVVNYPFAF